MRAVHVAVVGFASPLAVFAGDQPWVEFTNGSSMLDLPPGAVSSNTDEVDFAWADLDGDGDTDLVAVRKQPFTTSGMRVNLLLMNEGGVLRDRSAQFASASSVAGDSGFLTPTNDRDVEITDVDGDGWLDVVTATTRSAGSAKHVGHPRVYRNLGADGSGNWLGLRFEDARFPQLLVGVQPTNPDFCGVSSGDVTGNGMPDLYFADYGSHNDRFLVNDGNGFFTDESAARMPFSMLESDFGTSTEMADLNGDGLVDIIKDTALAITHIRIAYNDESNPGFATLTQTPYNGSAYHVESGDLNGDGRVDLLISDDNLDRYLYNTGLDPLGRVEWGPAKIFAYPGGGFDEGIGGENLITDLDGDGFNEAIVADVDVDFTGCFRRANIYRNPGGPIGSQITLEEVGGADWIGVGGLQSADYVGTYGMAVFDIDSDGDDDLILGRCAGTFVWRNETIDGAPCGASQFGLDLGGANVATLTPATTVPRLGQLFRMQFSSWPEDGLALYVVSGADAALPLFGGTLLVDPTLIALTAGVSIGSDGWGYANFLIPDNPSLAGKTAYVQGLQADPAQAEGIALSNGVSLTICP